uniref:Uncharacterized protein n=1 Tax=Kalanchoe fedtschenkoi TaxID=63787 RepID=A0A7N0RAP5_KALFE
MRAIGVPPPPPAAPTERHSAWRSPLPYLLGGVSAMMLLIITALLILIYSYWKHITGLERAEREQRGLWAGGERSEKVAYAEEFVVIMAGDENPTRLATPKCCRGVASDVGGKQTTEVAVKD